MWEMAIKSQIGKLQLRLPLADIVAGQQANGLQLLSVDANHVLGLESLPLIHKDPFDRLLIAQAIKEDAEFVSADPKVAQYPVRVLW